MTLSPEQSPAPDVDDRVWLCDGCQRIYPRELDAQQHRSQTGHDPVLRPRSWFTPSEIKQMDEAWRLARMAEVGFTAEDVTILHKAMATIEGDEWPELRSLASRIEALLPPPS